MRKRWAGKPQNRHLEIYKLLEPQNPLFKHEWLFAKRWVDESHEEAVSDDYDFRKRDQRIEAQRVAALREVYQALSLTGVVKLAERGDAATVIGYLLPEVIDDNEPSLLFVHSP